MYAMKRRRLVYDSWATHQQPWPYYRSTCAHQNEQSKDELYCKFIKIRRSEVIKNFHTSFKNFTDYVLPFFQTAVDFK